MSVIEYGFFYGGDGYFNQSTNLFTSVLHPKYCINTSGISWDTFVNSIYEAPIYNVSIQWMVTAASFIFFYLLNKFGSQFLPTIKHYNSLNLSDQRYCKNKFTSTIHAIISSALSWYLLLTDLFGSDIYGFDPPRTSGLYWEYTLHISIGYFLYDAIDTGIAKTQGWRSALAHHVVAISAFCFCSLYHRTTYYATELLTFETTTPFVNYRWWLSKTGRKKTKLYFYNALIMFVGFIAIRVGFQIIVLIDVYYDWKFISNGPLFLVIYFHIPIYILFLINLYWTYLLIKGAALLLKKKNLNDDNNDDKDD